ncbi:MAG: hypothetical protein FGM14_16595 [Flavobacteriales bacterium]|nr:hypothetical protein [Flavobacteriales bacterium]
MIENIVGKYGNDLSENKEGVNPGTIIPMDDSQENKKENSKSGGIDISKSDDKEKIENKNLILEIVDSYNYAENSTFTYHFTDANEYHYSAPKGTWNFYHPNGKLSKSGQYAEVSLNENLEWYLLNQNINNHFLEWDFELLEGDSVINYFVDEKMKSLINNGYYQILLPENNQRIKPWKYFSEKGKEIKKGN